MNKVSVTLLTLMALVIGFAVVQFRQNENQKVLAIETKKIVHWRLIDLLSVEVTADDRQMLFAPKDEVWWMTTPYQFPAQQEVLFATYEMMAKVLSEQTLQSNQGDFGLKEPQGRIILQNKDGRRLELTIGAVEAPGNKIYVHSSLDDAIYVVHNAWAQLLHQPVENYLLDRIFIGLDDINKFSYDQAGKKQWTATKVDSDQWRLEGQGKSSFLGPKEILSLWQKIARVHLTDHRFTELPEISAGPEFNVFSEQGTTIKISFNPELTQVRLHHLGAVATVNKADVAAVLSLMEKVLANNAQ